VEGSTAYAVIMRRRRQQQQQQDPHDVINIQFTSGTTGLPKAVALTSHSLVNNGHAIQRAQVLGPDDRVCIPVPLYHCFGVVLGSLACIAVSAAIVLPCRTGFSPARTLAAVASERCTALYGVPTMFIAELALPELKSHDLTSLRTGIMAGSLCPPDVMQRVHRELGMTQVTIAYGMTETSPVSWQSHAEGTPFEKLIHTVGRVLPHVECKVVDSATGVTVPIGERGELLTRGYLVMHGYWGDAEATAAAVDADGWMRTGDLVSIDQDGYCTVVGRSKDLIIRGGENIAPKEVEDTCYSCELVQDVSVVGVPDERYGEQVCACVVLRPGVSPGEATAEQLRSFCRERLSHFKVPKHVRFVAEFPMTVSGKVQKFKLVAESADALGLCGE
jgi:fatty-acyl-CoA synthase